VGGSAIGPAAGVERSRALAIGAAAFAGPAAFAAMPDGFFVDIVGIPPVYFAAWLARPVVPMATCAE
jgi:hypothetical protein